MLTQIIVLIINGTVTPVGPSHKLGNGIPLRKHTLQIFDSTGLTTAIVPRSKNLKEKNINTNRAKNPTATPNTLKKIIHPPILITLTTDYTKNQKERQALTKCK